MATSSPNKFAIERRHIDSVGFIVTLAGLLLLCIQSALHPLHQGTLSGAELPSAFPEVNLHHWSSGELQAALEHRAHHTAAFRPALVRTINQFWFTLFGEHTQQVVDGADGQLFERGYRSSVCGLDFVGWDNVNYNVQKLSEFNNYLIANGQKLIIAFAPNKWRTFSNQIPWDCKAGTTNYEAYSSVLRQQGFTVCDFIDLFVFDHRRGSAFPLHATQGTHWSVYGAAVSADYLRFSFAEQSIRLPRIVIEGTEVDTNPRYTDKDLFELFNLWQRPAKEELAYPKLRFETGFKPNVLVVGDSYYWTYYYLGIHQGLFDANSTFLYYNQSMVGSDPEVKAPLTDEMRKRLLQNADVVLLVMSEPSLADFGFGLLDQRPWSTNRKD